MKIIPLIATLLAAARTAPVPLVPAARSTLLLSTVLTAARAAPARRAVVVPGDGWDSSVDACTYDCKCRGFDAAGQCAGGVRCCKCDSLHAVHDVCAKVTCGECVGDGCLECIGGPNSSPSVGTEGPTMSPTLSPTLSPTTASPTGGPTSPPTSCDAFTVPPNSYNAKEDFTIEGTGAWWTDNNEGKMNVRAAGQNGSSTTTADKIILPTGTSHVDFSWVFVQGYCNVAGGCGQGRASILKLVLDGTEVWRSDINMATEDFSAESNCCTYHGPLSWSDTNGWKEKNEAVTFSPLEAPATVVFQAETFERNMHFGLTSLSYSVCA